MVYVQGCYDTRRGSFIYGRFGLREPTRAMAGAGIVSLSMGGKHDLPMAHTAGRWVLSKSFDRYNRPSRADGDRFHYGLYYCSQAMYQLGGEYWARFYPRVMRVLLSNQNRDGSWDAEAFEDSRYGAVYTTALSVLALTPPYQILPIYQR